MDGYLKLEPNEDGYVFAKAGAPDSSIRARDMVLRTNPDAFDELAALVRLRSL